MFTSQAHALEKYPTRIFASEETEQGWHGNRLNILRHRLVFPEKSLLQHLPDADSRQFDTSRPYPAHYWEW